MLVPAATRPRAERRGSAGDVDDMTLPWPTYSSPDRQLAWLWCGWDEFDNEVAAAEFLARYVRARLNVPEVYRGAKGTDECGARLSNAAVRLQGDGQHARAAWIAAVHSDLRVAISVLQQSQRTRPLNGGRRGAVEFE
mgnify:CR=1 FL=1